MSAPDVPTMEQLETLVGRLETVAQRMKHSFDTVLDELKLGNIPTYAQSAEHNARWQEMMALWLGYQRRIQDLLNPRPKHDDPLPKPSISLVEAQRGLDGAHGLLRNIMDARLIEYREGEEATLEKLANRQARWDKAARLMEYYQSVVLHWAAYERQQATRYFTTGQPPDGDEAEPQPE